MSQEFEDLKNLIHDVDKKLAIQNEILREHMRRTEIAEEGIKILHNDLAPLKKHVAHVEGGLKLLGGLATAVGILTAIAKLFI